MSITKRNVSICRVCMCPNAPLKLIFTPAIFVEQTLQVNEVMKACASVQVEISDGLPEGICDECLSRLREAYAFKILCENTDFTLRNNLVVDIKLEFEEVAVDLDEVKTEESVANNKCNENEKIQNFNEQKDFNTFIKVEEVSSDNSKENLAEPTAVKQHQCETCGKTYAAFSSLWVHRRNHLNIKPFECDVCNKRCTNIQDLKKHKRTHSGEKPYMCDLCGICFATNSNLHKHKKQIHTKLPRCPVCSRHFPDRIALADHRKTHTEAKAFQCVQCAKPFLKSSYLKIHMRTHTGERPYGCLICDKHFTTSSSLALHKKIHTGEKPFECDVCAKLFSVNANLLRHMKRHSVKDVKNSKKH